MSFLDRFRPARSDAAHTQAESHAAVDEDRFYPTTDHAEADSDVVHPERRSFVVDVDADHEDALTENTAIDQGRAAEHARWERDMAAADASSSGLNADHAARYGWLHSGYEQAQDEAAAAREVLGDLSPAVAERVSALEERQGRPVTLPEVQWLQIYVNEQDTTATGSDRTPDVEQHHDVDEI